MRNIINIFSNILLVGLVVISSFIFYTENTTNFDKRIFSSIETQLDESLNVKSNIDGLSIKWLGLSPRIRLKNLNLSDDKNQILLKTPICDIDIDVLRSIQNGNISISQITINNTSISLKYDDSSLFFNNLNLLNTKNSSQYRNTPKIVFINSELVLTNSANNLTEVFNINNFAASQNSNSVSIVTKFNHDSSSDPINLIFKGLKNENGLDSKIYISANSIRLPVEYLPSLSKKVNLDRISIRVWITMFNNDIKRIAGNISSKSFDFKLNNSVIHVDNLNSDILFTDNGKSSTLGLTRMNYSYKDHQVNNNKIVFNKNADNELKVYIEKSDNKILRLLMKETEVQKYVPIRDLSKAKINKLQLHLSKKQILDYYSLSLKNISFNFRDKFFVSNISTDIYGTLNKGKVSIKNINLKQNNHTINQLSGIISYNRKGKSIYFSSSKLTNNDGYVISLVGKRVSKNPSIKIEIASPFNKIFNSLLPGKIDDSLNYDGSVTSKIFYHNDVMFTTNTIKDFVLNKSDKLYISIDQVDIFTSSNLVSSNRFNLNINDQKQSSKIYTNINSTSQKYVLSTTGYLDDSIINNLLNLESNIIVGKTKFKSLVNYNITSKSLSLYSTSDLKGVSLNLIDPWSKTKKEQINFILNYQHFPKKSYPLKVNLDKHIFEFKNQDYSYIKLKSPAARGYLKYSNVEGEGEAVFGSFEYIDTSFYSSDKLKKYFPKIDFKSKHVKTKDIIFDNVHIIMTPRDNFIEINKLDFKNLNLEMKAKGKWYTSNQERTEISANIKSSDFGQALRELGYSKTIKGGEMNAYLKGKWEGSLENFSFSSSNGEINMKINDGEIIELDKGTQAIGQVLGLFSIASIPKRLSLDFSDFFSKGLSFEGLESKIIINSGIADTQKMIINGSFGEMRVVGKSDLIKRTHDQVLIFIPDLSSTSLVTGAVIGGPIGAAASIFYDRLLKEFGVDTNKLAGIEYSIKGSWDNPEIKVTQSFKPILN